MLGAQQRAAVGYRDVTALARVGRAEGLERLEDEVVEQLVTGLEIEARYAGYIERQSAEIERQRRQADTPLPADLDYAAVRGLSNEIREKLAHIRPADIGQAARISGVTPAAVSLLLIHLKKRRRQIA